MISGSVDGGSTIVLYGTPDAQVASVSTGLPIDSEDLLDFPGPAAGAVTTDRIGAFERALERLT